jgi:hypothetical protein|nr:MAG TPA: hypothetical protein [Caudoviricetes sp.]
MKRKIKLRDMTKEQWDKFLDNCYMTCDTCPFGNARCQKSECKTSWFNNKDLFSDKFLDQEVEIETLDILDEAEKRYLRAVIRSFRNKVIYIRKYFYALSNAYSIEICIYSSVRIFEKEIIRLPLFKNEMYKGMAKNKPYTLEELEL